VVAADSMVVMAGPPCDRKTSQPATVSWRSWEGGATRISTRRRAHAALIGQPVERLRVA
jgi:hypothetical protein